MKNYRNKKNKQTPKIKTIKEQPRENFKNPWDRSERLAQENQAHITQRSLFQLS